MCSELVGSARVSIGSREDLHQAWVVVILVFREREIRERRKIELEGDEGGRGSGQMTCQSFVDDHDWTTERTRGRLREKEREIDVG